MLTPTISRRFIPPLVITGVVLASAAAQLPPLIRMVAPSAAPIATLRSSALYSVLAPISDVLDTVTLFSPLQYVATFGLIAFLLVGIELWRRRGDTYRARAIGLVRCSARLGGGAFAAIGLVLLLPRPMASLSLNDPELLAVDFHSHTSASHDGRAGFDAERNRAWHASSGFDVAYVTDHQTFVAGLEGMRRNPHVAGDGEVLLPGIELRHGNEHMLLLGADPIRSRVVSPELKDLYVSPASASIPPLLVVALPGYDRRISGASPRGTVLGGIEVSDGCPRGLAEAAAHADVLEKITRTLNVASISGSDNHGWGRTSAAWSILRIRGWRTMSPSQIDDAVRASILRLGPRAVEVVARRRVPPANSTVGTALGGVAATTLMLRTMTWPDRVSWIWWTWIIWLVAGSRARRRRDAIAGAVDAPSKTPPRLQAAAMDIA
jgi:hypothetical protein